MTFMATSHGLTSFVSQDHWDQSQFLGQGCKVGQCAVNSRLKALPHQAHRRRAPEAAGAHQECKEFGRDLEVGEGAERREVTGWHPCERHDGGINFGYGINPIYICEETCILPKGWRIDKELLAHLANAMFVFHIRFPKVLLWGLTRRSYTKTSIQVHHLVDCITVEHWLEVRLCATPPSLCL